MDQLDPKQVAEHALAEAEGDFIVAISGLESKIKEAYSEHMKARATWKACVKRLDAETGYLRNKITTANVSIGYSDPAVFGTWFAYHYDIVTTTSGKVIVKKASPAEPFVEYRVPQTSTTLGATPIEPPKVCPKCMIYRKAITILKREFKKWMDE